MSNDTTQGASLAPCPWCGAGETSIHINKGTWTGSGYGEPVSVEVRHWCEPEAGQPSRMVTRVGRDEASAVAAWNRRAPQPPAVLVPLTDEQIASAWRQWHRTSVTSAARAIEFLRFCGIPGAAT